MKTLACLIALPYVVLFGLAFTCIEFCERRLRDKVALGYRRKR